MGTLSIVATPIGNLEDITLRALRTLKEVDCILCEDTRVTKKLLARHGISRSVMSYHAHSDIRQRERIVRMLEEGKHFALVTDAGTPGISDPGAELAALARAAGARIESVPGPSALTAALSIAGLTDGTFTFLGFLPHKKGRHTALTEVRASTRPVVLYESPHRILKLLKELGGRRVTIARELTKVHEEVLTGVAEALAAELDTQGKDRGEFVVIVHPA